MAITIKVSPKLVKTFKLNFNCGNLENIISSDGVYQFPAAQIGINCFWFILMSRQTSLGYDYSPYFRFGI